MENLFAQRLRELRQEQNIGQNELAKELGVSKGIISLWENDLRKPGMDAIITLSRYFKVSTDYLLGESDF